FTPKDGTVRVMVRGVESGVRIEVSDTGKGIAQDVLPKIFERFHQADPSTTRAEGGLGLGLAIVRHIVELHGGTVEANSPGLGGGTGVVVTLPYADARGIGARVFAHADAAPASPEPRLDDLRLLVVEDDSDALAAISAVLQRAGAHVESVRS